MRSYLNKSKTSEGLSRIGEEALIAGNGGSSLVSTLKKLRQDDYLEYRQPWAMQQSPYHKTAHTDKHPHNKTNKNILLAFRTHIGYLFTFEFFVHFKNISEIMITSLSPSLSFLQTSHISSLLVLFQIYDLLFSIIIVTCIYMYI